MEKIYFLKNIHFWLLNDNHMLKVKYKNTLLRPIEEKDLEPLRIWRNETKTHFLRQLDYITPEMQSEWFKKNNADESCYMFAIEEIRDLNRLVGSVALYNINGDTCECGRILIGDNEAHGRGIGYLAITLVLYLGFEKLGLNKIIADVYADNIPARKNNTKAGFEIVGRHIDNDGYEILEIAVTKGDFYGKHGFLDELEIKNG